MIGTHSGDKEREKLEWGAFLFLLLLLSSQPGSYHFIALVLTAAFVGDHLLSRGQCAQGGLALFLYCLICSPVIRWHRISETGWWNLLFFSRSGFHDDARRSAVVDSRGSHSLIEFQKRVAGFGVCSGADAVRASFDGTSFQRSVRQLQVAHRRYSSNLLASNPAPTSNDVLYTTMKLGWIYDSPWKTTAAIWIFPR